MNIKRERVIAERDGRGWLVMWPDGSVEGFANKRAVMKTIRQRLGRADALVTELEWRT